MNNYRHLRDAAFLKKIDNLQVKEQYVKITVLDFQENPVQEIQTRVTTGSISINGSSAIRRTCNLTLVASEDEIGYEDADNLISVSKKVNIELGIKNTFNKYISLYGDIVWFPLGVYVINSKSVSHTLEGVSISLSLKDKMCLLNGECGGVLPASITFNEIENIGPDGKIYITKPTIFQIIQELVHHFGGEQLGKIIISDIDSRVRRIMKWNKTTPLYIYFKDGKYNVATNTAAIPKEASYQTFNSGENVGYEYTDFIYPEELTSNIGDTIVSVLDKIKNILGNFEYFYDVHGNFIFQEIKDYLNSSKATIDLKNMEKDNYYVDMSSGKSVYTFDTSNLITSYSNAPKYSSIKNDYIVWGERKTPTGNKMSIRYHLAIDKKPKIGNAYKCFLYTQNGVEQATIPIPITSLTEGGTVGLTYFRQTSPTDELVGIVYTCIANTKNSSDFVQVGNNLTKIITQDWRTELYFQGLVAQNNGTDAGYYFSELSAEWPQIYDIRNGKFKDNLNPSDINYYLDFIESDAAVGEFNIGNIGRRTKAINDSTVNCLFTPTFPDLVLLNGGSENLENLKTECDAKGQQWVILNASTYSSLVTGINYKSAYDEVRNQLYQCTSYNESITVQSLPIFYLEPNTRITVVDPSSGIGGDYIIKNISLPLAVTGTMNLSCTRALQRI